MPHYVDYTGPARLGDPPSCAQDPDFSEWDKVYCAAGNILLEAGNGVECPHSLALLVLQGCPHCAEAQRDYADLIEMNILHVVDAETPRGQEIAEQVFEEHVRTPAFILADCANKVVALLD